MVVVVGIDELRTLALASSRWWAGQRRGGRL